jgi:hypothetical protein
MQLSSRSVRVTAWTALLAGASVLGGCASSSKNGPSTAVDGEAAMAPAGSPEGVEAATLPTADAPQKKKPGGQLSSSEIDAARAEDPSGILRRVPDENIHVSLVKQMPDEGQRAQSAAMSRALISPAVQEYAALGQYLKGYAETAPANQKVAIDAMSGFAFAISQRISLFGNSPAEIEIADKFKASAKAELEDWLARANPRPNLSRLAQNGELVVNALAESPPAPVGDVATELKDAWTKTALLLITVREYGSPVWGDSVTDSRRQAVNQLATIIENDLALSASGGALDPMVVQSNLRVAAAAEKLMQVILIARDLLVPKLRLLSPQGGAEIMGTGMLDSDALAKFAAFAGLNPMDESTVLRWALLRDVPKVSPRFFSGTQAAPSVTGSPEISASLQAILKDNGLVE